MFKTVITAALLLAGCQYAKAWDMHVNKPLPVQTPYCGSSNGMLSDCWMANGVYPRPRHTESGWQCPTQFHVTRNGCEEET